jgi:hypothetical protein
MKRLKRSSSAAECRDVHAQQLTTGVLVTKSKRRCRNYLPRQVSTLYGGTLCEQARRDSGRIVHDYCEGAHTPSLENLCYQRLGIQDHKFLSILSQRADRVEYHAHAIGREEGYLRKVYDNRSSCRSCMCKELRLDLPRARQIKGTGKFYEERLAGAF